MLPSLGFKMIFIYIVTICLSINASYGLRILGIFPFPMKSHHSLNENLMRGLAEKGHQVDVFSYFPLKTPVPNYKDYKFKGTVPMYVNSVTYETWTTDWTQNIFEFWFSKFGSKLCEEMDHSELQKLLKNPSQDPPYDIVIVELSVAYCYLPWGKHLNVPMIATVTSTLPEWIYDAVGSPLNLASDVSFVLPYDTPMTFWERFSNIKNYYTAVYEFYKYTKPQDKYVEKYFGPGYPPASNMIKDISLILVNYEQSLYGLRAFAPMIQPVGGLHLRHTNETLNQDVKKWLDESTHGCIYASFGSGVKIETFPKSVLEIFYKAFEKMAPIRVLWKIVQPELLPPGLPPNVMTKSWLQQKEVLKHKNTKAFVTHGGLMSTIESIYNGVPMVGIPLLFDQPANVAGCVREKIAVRVDLRKITAELFTSSLKEIIENPEYRERAKKVSLKFKDRPMSPLDTAIYWVEYIHRHGKDALKLPIIDLPWWKALNLDIYGLVAISITLILYIFSKIVKKLIFLNPNSSLKIKKNK